jgi:hypothetical protein
MELKGQSSNILLSSRIGFEFEFYSNYSVEKTSTLISRLLNKKISVEDKAHSDFSPTGNHYKIEPDMSGGKKLLELVTGSIPYQDARIELIKILKWINDNGSTSDKCGIHINISFDPNKTSSSFLSHMNILKFILDFDEDFIYDIFPDRKSSVYAKSIKYITPKNKYYFDNISNINPHDFIIPTEKYFGVNFIKLEKNYLEFRYLGGKNYEKRINDILKLIDHFIISLYNSAKSREFTRENYTELKRILNKYQHKVKAYYSIEKFKEYYPNVGLLVDLDSDNRRIMTYWSIIRDKLFTLLNECDLKDGIINYDSNTSKIQVKDADLTQSFKIENIDIVECKVKGVLTNCDIFNSELEESELYNCNLFNNTVAKHCKVMDCYTNKSSKLINCYVDGKNSIMNGSMEGGILRKGKITNLSTFDKNVEKIEFEKIKTNYYVNY